MELLLQEARKKLLPLPLLVELLQIVLLVRLPLLLRLLDRLPIQHKFNIPHLSHLFNTSTAVRLQIALPRGQPCW